MDLFEKIDLFEKMANELSDEETDLNSEEPELFNTTNQVRKEAIKVRSTLLKVALKNII